MQSNNQDNNYPNRATIADQKFLKRDFDQYWLNNWLREANFCANQFARPTPQVVLSLLWTLIVQANLASMHQTGNNNKTYNNTQRKKFPQPINYRFCIFIWIMEHQRLILVHWIQQKNQTISSFQIPERARERKMK